MPDSSEERTESPTPKRRSDARQKGSVAKSQEINSALILLAGLFLLTLLGPWIVGRLSGVLLESFGMVSQASFSDGAVVGYARRTLSMVAKIVLPVALSLMVIGLAANYIQIGFLFTLTPLIPKLDKLNPLAGMKRFVSLRSFVELAKNIMKLVIVGFVAYATIKSEFESFFTLSDMSSRLITLFLLRMAFTIVLRIGLVLIVLAILDFAYQKYEYEKNLKMTRQEVKEERKQMEGDPQIKSRVKSLQREMARRRMMQEVPKATVVVTNPTFIAIALLYEPAATATPRVVAKGKRLIAEQIRRLAVEGGVPVVEDKPLARAMYDRVEVGDEIPYDFYAAVAEILAYVYRLKNREAA